MKINVTVDLSEFFSDEDERSFSEQIKSEIARQTKDQILTAWKAQLSEVFDAQVKKEIELQKNTFITETVQDAIFNRNVKQRYGSKEMIPIALWIEEELQRTHLNNSTLTDFLNKIVKGQTDTLGKELKTKYDMLFATQIVSKLAENGMLKEDVAKLLLTDSKS